MKLSTGYYFYKAWKGNGEYIWQVCSNKPRSSKYTTPDEWLANAENMMRGDKTDCMWRKNDEHARWLIWC